MTLELGAILLAVLAVAGCSAFCRALLRAQAAEREEWNRERGQLLDRLMARDYTEYRTLEAARKPSSLPQYLTDEQELAYYQTQQP
ncbi:MAG TPA: hypothetical protein VF187_11220 [Gemmatimonadales bacterium]